jgi:hypothetical protein
VRSGVGGRADPGWYVIDIDDVLVEAASDKQRAAPIYKYGFGFYPLIACLDATGEALAGLLRQGNAGSPLPTTSSSWRPRWPSCPWTPGHQQVICRTDTVGSSLELAAACRQRGVRFIGGAPMRAQRAELIGDPAAISLASHGFRRWHPDPRERRGGRDHRSR